MTFIATLQEQSATGPAAEMLARARAANGYVPNMVGLFARRPHVFDAWVGLNGAIKSNMDLRRYELATLAAARELKSSYCMLAHGKVLLGGMLTEVELADVVDGSETALDETERAVMRFAAKVVRDATTVTQTDVDELRGRGLDDDEIFDIATAAAVRCFFSKTLDALGAQPDAAYSSLPDTVRGRLVIGRPIETEDGGGGAA